MENVSKDFYVKIHTHQNRYPVFKQDGSLCVDSKEDITGRNVQVYICTKKWKAVNSLRSLRNQFCHRKPGYNKSVLETVQSVKEHYQTLKVDKKHLDDLDNIKGGIATVCTLAVHYT